MIKEVISEQKLVILFQKTKNDNSIVDYFWKKYSEPIKKMCFKEINSKFYSIPLEYDDLTSIIYLSFIKTLKEFDTGQNKYNIGQALFTTSISTVRRQAISFIKNGHQILNNAYSYENNKYIGDSNESYNPERGWLSNIEYNEKLLKLKEKTTLLDKDLIKKILNLRALGNSNKEVAAQLGISSKKVSNTIVYLKRKLKKIL